MCYVEEFSLFNDVIFMTGSLLETAKALSECTEDDAAAFVESCLHRRHDDPIDPEEMLGQIVPEMRGHSHEQEAGMRLCVRCANLAVAQQGEGAELSLTVVCLDLNARYGRMAWPNSP